MKLYFREESGEYKVAGKKELLQAAQSAARLQHLQPKVSHASALVQYLQLQMMLLPEEQLRVIYVDNMNRIIQDEVLSSGTEDQTAVYPRKIMKRCLFLNATGLIISHNHPTGLIRPSNADIKITKHVEAAANALDIRLLDHVIIGSEESGYYSFRENGLLQ